MELGFELSSEALALSPETGLLVIAQRRRRLRLCPTKGPSSYGASHWHLG